MQALCAVVLGGGQWAESPEVYNPGVMDSGSVRRTGEEDGRENELKPFIAVQRVRHPPGKGAARRPEASLARDSNGSAKRMVAGAEAAG